MRTSEKGVRDGEREREKERERGREGERKYLRYERKHHGNDFQAKSQFRRTLYAYEDKVRPKY